MTDAMHPDVSPRVSPDAASSSDSWAGVSVVPGPGGGTLARIGPVVLLIGSADPDVVRPYVEHVTMVAANGGQGRQLVRGFALMLSTAVEASPGFVAMAPHTTGLAVFVDGDVEVSVGGEVISGADSLAWVERLLPWPVGPITASLPGTTPPDASSGFHLSGGVIPAGSLSVLPGGSAAAPAAHATPAAPVAATPSARDDTGPIPVEPAPAPVVPPVAVPAAPEPPAPVPPAAAPPPLHPAAVPGGGRPLPPAQPDEHIDFQSVLLEDVDDEDDFEPLPIVEDAAQVAPHDHGHEEVRGVFCKNRHFNDPRQLFCAVCGINMVQQTPVLVSGRRPPLGVIVIDDGAVFQLDIDYLLGRDPDGDERVRDGSFRGLPVIDQSHQVSRVHARLELRGWDVVLIDNASTNGTFVHVPGAADWMRLPPGGEHILVQGTRVRIGHRTLAFNTHAGGH